MTTPKPGLPRSGPRPTTLGGLARFMRPLLPAGRDAGAAAGADGCGALVPAADDARQAAAQGHAAPEAAAPADRPISHRTSRRDRGRRHSPADMRRPTTAVLTSVRACLELHDASVRPRGVEHDVRGGDRRCRPDDGARAAARARPPCAARSPGRSSAGAPARRQAGSPRPGRARRGGASPGRPVAASPSAGWRPALGLPRPAPLEPAACPFEERREVHGAREVARCAARARSSRELAHEAGARVAVLDAQRAARGAARAPRPRRWRWRTRRRGPGR